MNECVTDTSEKLGRKWF